MEPTTTGQSKLQFFIPLNHKSRNSRHLSQLFASNNSRNVNNHETQSSLPRPPVVRRCGDTVHLTQQRRVRRQPVLRHQGWEMRPQDRYAGRDVRSEGRHGLPLQLRASLRLRPENSASRYTLEVSRTLITFLVRSRHSSVSSFRSTPTPASPPPWASM